MTPAELVLGLPRDCVPGGLDWLGVVEAELAPLLDAVRRDGTFRPRAEVEEDRSWKQVIPYLLLRDDERIFLMKRTKAGADERLHDRYSIGVGGHVNPEDGDIFGGLSREWAEEMEADFTPDFEPVGLLNDDSNLVGAVHLGLVFVADAQGRAVSVRETEKLSGQFVTLDEAAAVADAMETWSSLLLGFLLERSNRPRMG